ncbi:hypothetical protein BDF14DRAFT_1750103 [Spinellus fusiger]|nr:hypothetical protein BDF14DRAFT_1750103 [Spinellus fusiger]
MQQSNGRWQSTDCSRVLPVACRHKDDPHKVRFILMVSTDSFERAPLACNDPYLFECPRQATENNALFIAIQNSSSTVIDKQAVQNGLVWIELNVLSRTNCWVLGKLGMCWWLNKVNDIPPTCLF